MVSNFDLNRTALNNQMMGLSTDTKPTTGILPNSLFWELDTNGMYYFDGTQWQSIGGSGGGGDLMKCTKSLNDNDQWVLNKTFNELKEAIDSGILPYLDAEITLGDVKCKRQLMLTGLSDESTNNPEPYYYVQFGAVKSGFVLNFESSTPTEQMAMC